MLGSILYCVTVFVRCSPVTALWESAHGAIAGTPRWPPILASLWQANYLASRDAGRINLATTYSAFLDFSLAPLPVTILRNRKVSPQEEIRLIFTTERRPSVSGPEVFVNRLSYTDCIPCGAIMQTAMKARQSSVYLDPVHTTSSHHL